MKQELYCMTLDKMKNRKTQGRKIMKHGNIITIRSIGKDLHENDNENWAKSQFTLDNIIK